MKDFSGEEALSERLIDFITDHGLIQIMDVEIGGEIVSMAVWSVSASSQISAFLSELSGNLGTEFLEELDDDK